jgi:polar amino acid transport system substrate-binding protein
MKRLSVLGIILVSLMMVSLVYSSTNIQNENSIPTLTPPTLVPQAPPLIEDTVMTTSTIARIVENNVLNVGILYNSPPFSELNVLGLVSGFDADIANSIAKAWEVDTNFVQITRDAQRTAEMLKSGEIDLVIASQVHYRELDPLIEFSQTYYISKKAIMVMSDSTIQTFADLSGQRLGVVIASPSAELAQTIAGAEIVTFMTLDEAYRALLRGDIGAIAESEHNLVRVATLHLESIRILDESLETEPYAIGFLRQDEPMRELVNRTLQYLVAVRRMDEILQVHFPGERYGIVRVWKNIPEAAPNPSEYPTQITYPAEYVMPRIQTGGVIRVVGMFGAGAGSPESEIRLDAFHRRMIDEMASRWGVRVEYITATGEAALNMIADGTADIAVGLEPDWGWADKVDFTGYYLLHGERLMIADNANVVGITSLRNRSVLIPQSEPETASWLTEIARLLTVTLQTIPQREQDLAFALLGGNEEIEADAVFGNSLRLIPHVQANSNLRLTDHPETTLSRWYGPSNLPGEDYSPRVMVMAVPNNDVDFRLLVEYTLQEIIREGRLREWLQPLMLEKDIPEFEIWPGSGIYLGFNLSR